MFITTKPTHRERVLMSQAASQMRVYQAQVDVVDIQIKRAREAVDALREVQLGNRGKLVPLSKILSACANERSRLKYFPEFDAREAFLVWAESELGAD